MFRDWKSGVDNRFRSSGSGRPHSTMLSETSAHPTTSPAVHFSPRHSLQQFELPKTRAPTVLLQIKLSGDVRSNGRRAMKESPGTVFVIDDDASIRSTLETLVSSVGLEAELFGSAEEFQQIKRRDAPSCLILAVRLPGTSGLDFQRQLTEKSDRIPIIFLTGYGDIRMAVQAMKAGAVDFLTKPFRDQEIIDAIHEALRRDRLRRFREGETAEMEKRLELLTRRERQVLPLVVSGFGSKQIAAETGMSEAAAKVHRSQLMRKLGAPSVAKLVRMALKLGIPSDVE